MHIIVVSNAQAAPRSFALGPWHLAGMVLFLLTSVAGMALGLHALVTQAVPMAAATARGGMAAVADVGPTLNMMAVKLGEMEAQLLRLDAFSARMAHMLGPRVAPPERPAGTPERHSGNDLEGLRQQLATVALRIQERTSQINQLESAMLDASAEGRTLPTTSPIPAAPHSSNYGARSDPFDGTARFHPGIDFQASAGTAFVAAATGRVTAAHTAPDYGNMIEIDHGNGLTTRYAHAERLDVREGDLVMKGQAIGLVGSTGRSTGPHLHFEVRNHGQTLNPEKFLHLQG